MEHGENGYKSRAEWIRMARENCNLSLGGMSSNQVDNRYEEEERRLIEESSVNKDGTIYITKVQGFVLRLAVAAIIFLCVMLMDKYKIGNETVNQENMKKILTSSEQAHQVEELAKEWVNKKIPMVLRSPNE